MIWSSMSFCFQTIFELLHSSTGSSTQEPQNSSAVLISSSAARLGILRTDSDSSRWVMGKWKPNYSGVLGWTSLYQNKPSGLFKCIRYALRAKAACLQKNKLLQAAYFFANKCSVILFIHAPVHIYGVTYYSTTTTSDVVVAYNTSGPWNLMLSGHANY